MNGPHDLGGLHGFGPVQTEADEPLFHAPWERRVFALTLAMGATGSWNIDQSRAARESIGPQRYRNSSYYQIICNRRRISGCRLMCVTSRAPLPRVTGPTCWPTSMQRAARKNRNGCIRYVLRPLICSVPIRRPIMFMWIAGSRI